MAPQWLEAAGTVFKCTNNGSVPYQNDPCPTGRNRAAPTVPASAPQNPFPNNPWRHPPSRAPSVHERPPVAAAPNAVSSKSFKYDGRIHCSQMTSGAEAQYFLIRCPGVKMDGDRDGIPCREQWCTPR
jgi:hypothetical protein